MNELIVLNNSLMKKYNIKKIDDLCDTSLEKMPWFIQRMRVYFNNGSAISIIRGEYTKGGKDGLFEIAQIDKNNEINDDYVLGYLTKRQVMEHIKIIGSKELKAIINKGEQIEFQNR